MIHTLTSCGKKAYWEDMVIASNTLKQSKQNRHEHHNKNGETNLFFFSYSTRWKQSIAIENTLFLKT